MLILCSDKSRIGVSGNKVNFISFVSVNLKEYSAVAEYLVPADAEYLKDHFPETPMLPGLLMLEIAVQAAGLWMMRNSSSPEVSSFDLDSLEHLYISRRVIPDEILKMKVKITEITANLREAQITAEGFVSEEKAMKAKFHMSGLITKANCSTRTNVGENL